MKLYQVVAIKGCDEFLSYCGTEYSRALEFKKQEMNAYEKLTDFDKKQTEIECRVYSIDDDVDINDIDELTNALIECTGYDLF